MIVVKAADLVVATAVKWIIYCRAGIPAPSLVADLSALVCIHLKDVMHEGGNDERCG